MGFTNACRTPKGALKGTLFGHMDRKTLNPSKPPPQPWVSKLSRYKSLKGSLQPWKRTAKRSGQGAERELRSRSALLEPVVHGPGDTEGIAWSRNSGFYIVAFMIRVGFWCHCTTVIVRNPPNSIGSYFGPYIRNSGFMGF